MSVNATSIRAWQTFLAYVVLGAMAMLAASGSAHAISCGDTLGPGGSLVLSEDLVCGTSPALTIEGMVDVDLQGHTVACALNNQATLTGTGIRLEGSKAFLHDGRVEDCHRGVVVAGEGSHRLERLTVTSAPEVDGDDHVAIEVQSDHNRIMYNTVEAYAGEAYRLDGANGNMLKYNLARNNGDHGYRVRLGRRNMFLKNTAQGNVGEGFRSQDRDNRFESNTATFNGDEGIRLRDASAQNNLIVGNTVKDNGLSPCNPLADTPDINPGIAVTRDARNNQIKNNTIKGNCVGIGLEKDSQNNKIRKNNVSKSQLFDMIDANKNCGNNNWRKNKFKTSVSGPFPPGVPFAPCIRFGNPVATVADKEGEVVEDGESLAKDGGAVAKDRAKDAGSAAKDAAKKLF